MLVEDPFFTMAEYTFRETHSCHSHVGMRASSLMRAFKVVYNHAFLKVISDGRRVILHN